MAIAVGHAVVVALEVIAFDELHALIAQTEVVDVHGQVAALYAVHAAPVVDGDAVQFIEPIADLMLAVGIDAGDA